MVLTGSAVAKERAVALEAGAAAVLDKAASFAEIVAAVRRLGARGRD